MSNAPWNYSFLLNPRMRWTLDKVHWVSTTGRHSGRGNQRNLRMHAIAGQRWIQLEASRVSQWLTLWKSITRTKQTMITRFTTTNFALSAALVSASATETRLIISNPGMHAFAKQGLRLPDADRDPVGGRGCGDRHLFTASGCGSGNDGTMARQQWWTKGYFAGIEGSKKSVALLQSGVC